MVQGQVVDKVPLPTQDEDIDRKCLRGYKVYDHKCVETGVRGDPPWSVEEDFPIDTVTEVFMVHPKQKAQTAAFVVALHAAQWTLSLNGECGNPPGPGGGTLAERPARS